MNRASFTTNRFGTRWGGFLMPFCGMEVKPVEDTIEFIGTLLVAAIKITLYVTAIIALAKYIMA